MKRILDKSSFIYNLILTLGIVIGVGIFFKNTSIIKAAHGNSTYVIIAWIIGGSISVSTAYVFADLIYKVKNNNNNISEFVRETYGEKAGLFAKKSFAFIYYPIYSFVIAIFTTDHLLKMFNKDIYDQTFGLPLLLIVAVSITVLVMFFASYIEKISSFTQLSTTTIKLIPFGIMIIIVFIAMFNGAPNAIWHDSSKIVGNPQTKGMSGIGIIFWMVPATKFAFDGFLTVTANRKNTKPKTLKAAMSIGMLLILVLYLVLAIAVLSSGQTSVSNAIASFFTNNDSSSTTYIVLEKTISIIIIISGFGSLNGFSIVWKRTINQLLEDNKIKTSSKNTMLYMLLGLTLSSLPWIILTFILYNQGVSIDIFDKVSDIVLLFAFSTNALTLIKFLYRYFKKQIEIKLFTVILMFFSILSILFVVGFKLIDDLIIEMINHGNDNLFGSWPRYTYYILFFGVILTIISSVYTSKFFIDKNNKVKIIK